MRVSDPSYSRVSLLCKLLLTVLFGMADTAQADLTFCVGSNSQLAAALQAFEDEAEDTHIMLRQGSYALPRSTVEWDTNLTIVGGFTGNQCSQRAEDPALTVLGPEPGHEYAVLSPHKLNLQSLTFRGFDEGVLFVPQGNTTTNGSVHMSRIRLEDATLFGHAIYADESFLSQIVVQSSGTDVSCALSIDRPDDVGDLVRISHSTFANNPGKALCIGGPDSDGDDGYDVRIENSIFWGNPLDVELRRTSDFRLRHNIIAGFWTQFSALSPAASVGQLSADPLFVDAAAGDFRLKPASPAINSGATSVLGGLPYQDISGKPRWTGAAPDRGAHESDVQGVGEELLVTDTGDSNIPGTLRWAINQANLSQNYSAIRFNMPGPCPQVIMLNSELPEIVTPIGIDGYSQPGSKLNTGSGLAGQSTNAVICTRIGSSGTQYGLRVPQSAGSNGQLGVSGVALGNFLQAAISIEAGIGSRVFGNHIYASPIGVFVRGSAEDTQIGGPDPWQVNLISQNNRDYGIALNWPSTRTRVENNLIGLNASGNGTTSGNGVGIGISSNENTIVNNAISGTSSPLALFNASRNTIEDNVLGRKVGGALCVPSGSCSHDLYNSSHGILIQGSSFSNRISRNEIANSGGSGIRVTEGSDNAFVDNAIWNSAALGIDLGNAGSNLIDNDAAPGAAVQANRGLNRPRLDFAGGQARSGQARGVMRSTNGSYLLQAFASPACSAGGQARWPLGWSLVTIFNAPSANNGDALFAIPLHSSSPTPPLGGLAITVTATEVGGSGHGSTSELSSCVSYTGN